MKRSRIRYLLRPFRYRRGEAKQDIDDEIRTHIALRVDQLIARGLDPAAARLEAERRFSRSGSTRRALYHTAGRRNNEMRFAAWMSAWMLDLRHAVRGLYRELRFTIFVVATLALGIGAVSAMYGIVDRLLIQGPDHVAEPHELVRLYLRYDLPRLGEQTRPWIGHPIFLNMTEAMTSLDGAAAYAVREELVDRGSDAQLLRTGWVSEEFFEVLGSTPQLGRFFGGGEQLAVISYNRWQNDFAGQPDVLGQTLSIQGALYAIAGVTRAGFTGAELAPVDVWVPLNARMAARRNWNVLGRRKAGVAIAQVGDDATAAHRNTYTGTREALRQAQIVAAPIRFDDGAREPAETTVARLLILAAGLVLLIACANVTNLLLARSIRRRREIAMRIALGASKWRLIRLLVAEGLVLGLVSGVAGVPVAHVIGSFVRTVLLPTVAWTSSPVDTRVLAFATGVALLTGLVVGVLPAAQAGRTDVTRGLKAGARAGGGRRSGLRTALMVAQMALSVTLLVGAGLFVRSLWRIQSQDLGLDAAQVVTAAFRFRLPESIAVGSDGEYQLYSRVLETVRSRNDVEAAGAVVGLPFSSNFSVSLGVAGLDSLPSLSSQGPYISAVSSGYFDAVGTRILRGRAFQDFDRAGSEAVVIVSHAMDDLFWPGEDALGKCLTIGDASDPCSRVVGIAENVHRMGYDEPPSMQVYIPLGQERELGIGGMALVIRPRRQTTATSAALQGMLRNADPAISFVDFATLQSFIDPELRPWRLGATILMLCGSLALLVAMFGVYSVLSYLVAQRTQELTVRIALGANRPAIAGLVLRTGIWPIAAGIGVGLGAAILSARWVEPLLYEIRGSDPLVLSAVALTLFFVAAGACVVPAVRASRVDPMAVLKAE